MAEKEGRKETVETKGPLYTPEMKTSVKRGQPEIFGKPKKKGNS